MRFDILTLFPESIEPYLTSSILGRAKKANQIETHTWNIRDYATDKHAVTDDTPYGGGAGMVMKVEPIDLALQAVLKQTTNLPRKKVIVLAPRGQQFTQEKAQDYKDVDQLIFICGRYEGIDQRVADYLADEELSVGPYVLSGGELPALIVVETVARLLPGVLGNPASLEEESFAKKGETSADMESYKEYPQYTKPEMYRDWKVPSVLLSGDHAKIKAWRIDQPKLKNKK